jgi:hypothetical protein
MVELPLIILKGQQEKTQICMGGFQNKISLDENKSFCTCPPSGNQVDGLSLAPRLNFQDAHPHLFHNLIRILKNHRFLDTHARSEKRQLGGAAPLLLLQIYHLYGSSPLHISIFCESHGSHRYTLCTSDYLDHGTGGKSSNWLTPEELAKPPASRKS